MNALATALVALFVSEAPGMRDVATARAVPVVAACERATTNATLQALAGLVAYRESRMDPNVCDRERDPDGRPNCDRQCLDARGRVVPPERDPFCRAPEHHLGPPRAEGAWQLQIGVIDLFGAACGARVLRDARGLNAGACMFLASIAYWGEQVRTLEAAMSSHAVGYAWRRRPGPIGRWRVAWARRVAP